MNKLGKKLKDTQRFKLDGIDGSPRRRQSFGKSQKTLAGDQG